MSGGFGSPGRMCGFKIDNVTEAWTPVTPPGATPVAVGSNPRAVAIEPSGRFVYVAGGFPGAISGFAIDRVTGVPTPLPGSPFDKGGSLPIPVVIDHSGRFMYVGQSVGSFDGSIAVFAIDAATGALSHIPGSPFPNVANGGRIAALALSPDGRFLFTGGSALATYSVNPVTGVPTRIASRSGYYYGLAVDPTGRFLFGVDDTDDLLHGYSIAADGALAPAGTPQAIGSVTQVTTAIVSVADLVYVGNAASGGVYGFRINPATGALTPVAGSPFAGLPQPSAFAATANLPPSIEVDAGDNVVASVGAYGGRPPYTWSIASGALPPGSALNATTGVFSGVAQRRGHLFVYGAGCRQPRRDGLRDQVHHRRRRQRGDPRHGRRVLQRVARPLLHHLRRRRNRQARQRHVQGLGPHGTVVQGLRHRRKAARRRYAASTSRRARATATSSAATPTSATAP